MRQARRAGVTGNQTGGGTIFTEQVLIINQKVRPFGSILGYAVHDQHGRRLGTVQELRRDLVTTLSDNLRGRSSATRAHRFQVVDLKGRVLLAMTQPKRGWFQMKHELVVDGPDGHAIGQIVHETHGVGGSIATAAHAGANSASGIARYGIGGVVGSVAGAALEGVQGRLSSAVEGLDKVGHARFGLQAGHQRLGSIHATNPKQWDFTIHDPAGTQIGAITKTWAGWTKERFTKADNYVVQMHQPLDDPLRSLVIAAALAIDVALKQGDQTSGSSLSGTRRYK